MGSQQQCSASELQLVGSPKVRGEVKGPLHTQWLQLLHHAQKPGAGGRGYFKKKAGLTADPGSGWGY